MTPMRQYTQTDILFSITGLLILLAGTLFFRSTFNLAIHDTYFVISQTHIAIALCVTFLFFSLLYFIFKKANRPLYKRLGSIHYILTVLPLVATCIIDLLHSRRRAYENFSEEMEIMEKFNIIISISVLLCLLGQLLLVTNIIATLLRKNASR